MKPIMITLMYLTFGGDIKLDTFEIQTDCSGWFNHNVKVVENKKKTLFSSREYHLYNDKKVIGYICGDNPPQ
tara:strand:+ start:587 stop:802 length:216 start_codon:yes stop_codon:yes gene_type:complete